jgi:hypothetical protein
MKRTYLKTALLLGVLLGAISVQAKSLEHILHNHQLKLSTELLPAHKPVIYGPFQEEGIEDLALEYSLVTVNPKGFVSFREALGFKESQGNYWAINTLGYMGKYQFGRTTLNQLGIYNTDRFLTSPRLQEKIFEKNLRYNRKQLATYIRKYKGKTVGGVRVTESGILAAAHLSGAGGVKRYLKSGGSADSSDAYGSTVRHYMKKFSGYNLSES